MEALLFCEYEDETRILSNILQQSGFFVRAAHNLENAIEDWPDKPSDFILITLSEDVRSSIKQIRRIRGHTVVPIVVLSDVLEERLQVDLLDTGVDLLISRPYSNRLLLAQIRAILRRGSGVLFSSLPTLRYRGISLNPSDRTVSVEDEIPKRLTQLEFRLLHTLMIHAGQTLPTESIVEHVWGYTDEGSRGLVRGLIQRLRGKVEPDPSNPKFIITDPGIGYHFIRNT